MQAGVREQVSDMIHGLCVSCALQLEIGFLASPLR